MGFSVIEHEIRQIWAPVNFIDTTDTLYEGQIVASSIAAGQPAGEGLIPINAAAGHSDTTGRAVPFGVVLAGNDAEPTYNSTYKGMSIASVGTQAAQLARNFRGAEGMYAKGDPMALAKVSVIGTMTVLKGPIFLAAYGTACTVYTNTTASSSGDTITTTAVAQTPVTYNTTWYCRTGANKGLYRVAYSTSTTSHTFYIHFPYAIAVGDTFVPVFLRVGTCLGQFDAESTFIEQQPATGTNDYSLDVLEINLEKAGEEYAIFKFNADQFGAMRA
uniref:Uncharacterized protein n=1 Tax=viral metagenome TaxID=1070528 RepID=A0A6M3ISJ7_9ZZZZ